MHKKIMALLVFGLSAGIFSKAALAVEPYLPKSPATFTRLDANSDGRISLSEIKPKAEKRLARYDADGNGAVSAAEFDAIMFQAVQKRRARIMVNLDADKDGSVSEAELDKMVEAMFNGADSDKDGGVTIEEARNFKVSVWKKALAAEQAPN